MSHRILFFLFFLSVSVTAQVGGKATYQFLNLVNNPRMAALGGKVITNADYDPIQAIWNPASINIEMDNQLSLNYTNYIGDINYGTVAFAHMINHRAQVLHAGVTYLNYGSFDGYDEMGNPTNNFSGGEIAFSVGYARNIPRSDIYVGANVKIISSKLEQYSSLGAAVDIGISYIDEDTGLNISAVGRNIGTQFKPYHEDYEPLPFEVLLGISQTLENVPIRWHFTLENMQKWDIGFSNPSRDQSDLEGNITKEKITFIDHALRHIIIGAELFPESGFNIRLGYNFRRGEELRILEKRAFAGLSGGFSVKLNKFRLSYSYSQYSMAASSSFFGLNIDFN